MPSTSAPENLAPAKFANRRSAPLRSACSRFANLRSADFRHALRKSWPEKVFPDRSCPLKSRTAPPFSSVSPCPSDSQIKSHLIKLKCQIKDAFVRVLY